MYPRRTMQPADDVTPARSGRSRLGTDPEVPRGPAFAGLALPGTPPSYEERTGELASEDREIAEAIAAEAGWMSTLLTDLAARDTTLGNEAAGQELMREAMHDLGLEPVDVPLDAESLRAHPLASPFDWDVSEKRNVVATWSSEETDDGRSLILNGHVDVVSPEPRSQWRGDPFEPVREGDWLTGRGVADMKGGLAAMLGAIRGLRGLGLDPHAPVSIQSVVEEEITGNGTLACVLAGPTADAAVIPEPFGAAITTSQVGVLWFRVRVTGFPGHAAEVPGARNAIEESLLTIQALRVLEAELNGAPPPPYNAYDHPIGLNVGAIHGGDWASTVPGECVTDYRIAMYPGMTVPDLQARIEAIVAEAAVGDPALFAPPTVEYRGFACEGYEIGSDHPLVTTLADTYARHTGAAPALVATTGTTDARIFGASGIPAVCFGPYGEQAHGVEERISLPSVVHTAQVLGLFIRDWCGLS